MILANFKLIEAFYMYILNTTQKQQKSQIVLFCIIAIKPNSYQQFFFI